VEKNVKYVTFSSSVEDFTEINESFDRAKLRIAYAGANRNNSYITKEAFEKAIPTMFNCPIVTHYDRDTDSLGGHDIELVNKGDNNYQLINLTTPVGVVPESANFWWDTVEDSNGDQKDYLSVEVLLWKRQEAYEKLKSDGIVSQSMEISINDGSKEDDGLYHIYDFDFMAFALIGTEPCFEDAQIELFSLEDKERFNKELTEMMADFKRTFSKINTNEEGGGNEVEKENKVFEEQVEEKAEAEIVEEVETTEQVAESEPAESDAPEAETEGQEEAGESEFALSSFISHELYKSVSEKKGKWDDPLYWIIDFDEEKGLVYVYSLEDENNYALKYTMDNDKAVIDWESMFKVKMEIVPYEEPMTEPAAETQEFDKEEETNEDVVESEDKQDEQVSEEYAEMAAELEELRAYKLANEKEKFDKQVTAIFDNFESLKGIEEFEQLRDDHSDMTLEAIEDKCYSILGRQKQNETFSLKDKSPKIKVLPREDEPNEPYGGIFVKYGIN
jgi:hypothetical protein